MGAPHHDDDVDDDVDDDDGVDDDDVDRGKRWCAIIVNRGQIRANAGAYSALLLWTPGRRKGKRPSGGCGQKNQNRRKRKGVTNTSYGKGTLS